MGTLSEFSVLIIQFGCSINNEHRELSHKAPCLLPMGAGSRTPLCFGSVLVWIQASSSLPDSTSKDTSEDGAASGASAPWDAIPWTTTALRPRMGCDADAQPGTGSANYGKCQLVSSSPLLNSSLSHTQRFYSSSQTPPTRSHLTQWSGCPEHPASSCLSLCPEGWQRSGEHPRSSATPSTCQTQRSNSPF